MKENKFRVSFHILWQLDIIMSLFVWIFTIAPYSFYSKSWNEEAFQIIRKSTITSWIILIILLIATVFCLFMSHFEIKKLINKGLIASILFAALIFVAHICIRVPLLGSYQLSDGLVYFSHMENNLYYPNNLLKDFLHSGFLAGGHISHGFIFVHVLGQLLNVPSGMGFQYSYMVLGALSACFIYGIIRKLLPDVKRYLCAIGAFIVSVQPLFLGLSTIAQMEYVITIAFIFSLFFILYRHYLLAAFCLLILGTCKETGIMMAFFLVGMLFLIHIIKYIVRMGGITKAIQSLKLYQKILCICVVVACLAVIIVVTNVPLWNGYKIIDVIKFGGEGTMNFSLNPTHLFFKCAQLFVLNFSWVWVLLLILALIINLSVTSIRKEKKISGYDFSYLIASYVVYTGFLLFFQEAKQPRYNMLSDVLFLLIAVTIILKILSSIKYASVPILLIAGSLSFIEAFVTVDPVSIALFSNINTGGKFPIVWTYQTKKQEPVLYINPGDFGMYNYHYTFDGKLIDQMLNDVDYQEWFKILSTSNLLAEDQLNNNYLFWDSKTRRRTYHTFSTMEPRFHSVIRATVNEELYGSNIRCIIYQSPYFEDKLDYYAGLFEDRYDVLGPYTIEAKYEGSIKYYLIMYK